MKLSLRIIRNELKIKPESEQLFYEKMSLNGVQIYSGEAEADIVYIVRSDKLKELNWNHPMRSLIVLGRVSKELLDGDIEFLSFPQQVSEIECLKWVQDIFLKYNRWESQILEEISEKCNLQKIMDLGSELIGNPIALFDLSMTSVCLGGQNMISKDNFIWKSVLENNTPPVEIVQALKDENVFYKVGQEKTAFSFYMNATQTNCIHANVYQNKARIGSVDLQDVCAPFSDTTCILVDYFVQFLSIISFCTELNRMGNEKETQMVKRLLQNENCRVTEIQNFYTSRGWKEQDTLRIFCFVHMESQEPDEYDLEMIHFKNKIYQAFVFQTGKAVVLIANEKYSATEQMEQKTQSILKQFQLCGGVSYPIEHLRKLPLAFRQAQEAALAMKRKGVLRIGRFEDIYIESFFAGKKEKMSHYIHPAVNKLSAYDQKHHTELLLTLYTYLANHSTLDICAKKLFIHKNTLLQRIKRIHEITGDDVWKEEGINMKLLMSCYIIMNNM